MKAKRAQIIACIMLCKLAFHQTHNILAGVGHLVKAPCPYIGPYDLWPCMRLCHRSFDAILQGVPGYSAASLSRRFPVFPSYKVHHSWALSSAAPNTSSLWRQCLSSEIPPRRESRVFGQERVRRLFKHVADEQRPRDLSLERPVSEFPDGC